MGTAPIQSPKTLARGFIHNRSVYVRTIFMVVGSAAGSELDEMAFRQNAIRLAVAADRKRDQT